MVWHFTVLLFSRASQPSSMIFPHVQNRQFTPSKRSGCGDGKSNEKRGGQTLKLGGSLQCLTTGCVFNEEFPSSSAKPSLGLGVQSRVKIRWLG